MHLFKTSSILLLSSAFTISNAQTKKEIKIFNIKSCAITVTSIDSNSGKEKKITDSYTAFDKGENIIEEKEHDRNGIFKNHESNKYNRNGDETERIQLDGKGNIIPKTITEYNSNNYKKTESIYDGKGLLIEKTQISYNPDGEKNAEVVTNASGKTINRSVYTCDKNGLKRDKKTFNAAGQLLMLKKSITHFNS